MTLTTDEITAAETDAQTLSAVVNGPPTGPSSTVISRLGRSIKTVSRVMAELASTALSLPPGEKGDPGGNVMAIGLFTDIGGIDIPNGTDMITVAGSDRKGVGEGFLIEDTELTDGEIAAHPFTMVKSHNGRRWRWLGALGLYITAFMCQAVDATGAPKLATEVVSDCSDSLDAMRDYVFWCAENRNELYGMSFENALGLGCSRTFVLDTVAEGAAPEGAATWNRNSFPIYPGRLVAMERMDDLVSVRNGNYRCYGEWQLWGGTDTQLNSGNYGDRLIKNGMKFYGLGASYMGDIFVQGALRYGACADHEYSDANNSIFAHFGKCVFIQCGTRNIDTVKPAGVVSGGVRNGSNGDDAQRHRMTLPLPAGIDPRWFEIGDQVHFGTVGAHYPTGSPGVIKAIPAVDLVANTLTVDIWPWQPQATGQDFLIMAGGGLDLWGANLANVTFEKVQLLSGGIGIRYAALFSPTIMGTLLCEQVLCDIQLGTGGGTAGESMQGIYVPQYHMENNFWSLIDYGQSAGTTLGVASALPADGRGKFSAIERPASHSVVGGVFTPTWPVSLQGVSIRLSGGEVHMPVQISGKGRDLGGLANNGGIIVGNSPENKKVSIFYSPAGFTFALSVDRSLTDKSLNDRTYECTVYGPNTADGNAEAITITPYEAGVTVNGGASVVIPAGIGAPHIKCVYEPPADNGLNGNWKILWTRWLSDYVPGGGGGGSAAAGSRLRALPIYPLTTGPIAFYDVQQIAHLWQDTAGTVAAAVDSPVARVDDLSGHGWHLLQATAGFRPILRKYGSTYYLEFDGVDDYLASQGNPFDPTAAQPFTLISAGLFDDANTVQTICCGSLSLSAIQVHTADGFFGYSGSYVGGGTFDTAFHVIAFEANGVASNLYVDDGLIGTGDAGAAAITGLFVGSSNGPSQYVKGLWTGMTLNAALSSANRKRIGAYYAAQASV
jgi:hypothetical protein